MSKPKIKEGDVLETYRGRFFKIAKVKDGMYGRTGFQLKKSAAENDTVVVRYLNSFGLTQILKDEEVADQAVGVSSRENQKGDTAKEITKMKVAELRELATFYGLSTDGKQADLVQRLTAHMEAEKADMTEHKVTQEDIDKYPILAARGVKVGDPIYLAKEDDETDASS